MVFLRGGGKSSREQCLRVGAEVIFCTDVIDEIVEGISVAGFKFNAEIIAYIASDFIVIDLIIVSPRWIVGKSELRWTLVIGGAQIAVDESSGDGRASP